MCRNIQYGCVARDVLTPAGGWGDETSWMFSRLLLRSRGTSRPGSEGVGADAGRVEVVDRVALLRGDVAALDLPGWLLGRELEVRANIVTPPTVGWNVSVGL